jgi:valyl-tRNA synthetase
VYEVLLTDDIAHDFNDYNLGVAHKLEFINILNDDGTLNANAGPFQGQKRFDARYTVVEELTKLGLFVGKTPNPMKIPLCEKSKDVIEPMLKPQWWMEMREMADEAVKAVEDGRIKIAPESANKSYRVWMKNITPWCISRQLVRISPPRSSLSHTLSGANMFITLVVGPSNTSLPCCPR